MNKAIGLLLLLLCLNASGQSLRNVAYTPINNNIEGCCSHTYVEYQDNECGCISESVSLNVVALVSFAFLTETGKTYRVEFAAELPAREWHIASLPIEGTGTYYNFNHPQGPMEQTFYRVRQM